MALRRNTVVGTMTDAINYIATRPSAVDRKPLLAVMKALEPELDIINFEVAPNLNRFMGMLRTGGGISIRLAAIGQARVQGPLCLKIKIPSNVSDFEAIYFGGLKPDGSVAIHVVRSRDVRNQKAVVVPVE